MPPSVAGTNPAVLIRCRLRESLVLWQVLYRALSGSLLICMIVSFGNIVTMGQVLPVPEKNGFGCVKTRLGVSGIIGRRGLVWVSL